jgi:hypothetical protein
MYYGIKFFASLVVIFSLAGCLTVASTSSSFTPQVTIRKFDAPLGVVLNTPTGGRLFVQGRYIPGEVVTLSQPVDVMIPGAYGIPFPVHIEPGPLELQKITPLGKYFCAEEGMAGASFPGLGSVIRQGDCVGVLIGRESDSVRWLVDNSNYNRFRTVWTSPIGSPLAQSIKPTESSEAFSIQSLISLSFTGFYGGQVHFTWSDATQTTLNTQNFTFDYKSPGKLKVGMKGYVLEVLSADTLGITYQWLSKPGQTLETPAPAASEKAAKDMDT